MVRYCRLFVLGWLIQCDLHFIHFKCACFTSRVLNKSVPQYGCVVCQTGFHHCSITFIAIIDLIHSSHYVLLFALLPCVLALDITLTRM